MYQNILVAFDGSPDGREALVQAGNLASVCGATVHLLAIIDPSENMLIVEAMPSIPDNQAFVIQSVLDEGVKRLRGAGCSATNELKFGKPADQIVLSAAFLERYQPDDAQLAFIIGHEIAHVLCQHERIRLSAVWRRNAPQQLLAQYAMEYLDTEPMVRAQIASIASSQERTADRIGMEFAAAIGVDPLEAVRFFDTSIAKDGGGIMPDMHDSPAERKTKLLQDVTTYPPLLAMRRGRQLNCGH